MTSTLHQRIKEAASHLAGNLEATGKSPFSKDAVLSIGDVEEAVGPVLTAAGVLTFPNFLEQPQYDASAKVWLVGLAVDYVNADNHEDRETVRTWDVGGTISGAVSYALKRSYKAVFHLVEAEAGDSNEAEGRAATFRTRTLPIRPAAETPSTTPTKPAASIDPELASLEQTAPVATSNGRPAPTATKPTNAVPAQRRPSVGPGRN